MRQLTTECVTRLVAVARTPQGTSHCCTGRCLHSIERLPKIRQQKVSWSISSRSLFSKKEDVLVTPPSSSDATPKVATTTEASAGTTRDTPSQRLLEYAKQFSKSLYAVTRDSTITTISWAGSKVSLLIKENSNRITRKVQASIGSTQASILDKTQGFRKTIVSKICDSMESLVHSVAMPIQSIGKYIVNLWRTTPIWNRFFWWSLSAIAVYGIATTVPKEIVKYAIISSKTTAVPPTESGSSSRSDDDVRKVVPEG
jgi:hypothetical protein